MLGSKLYNSLPYGQLLAISIPPASSAGGTETAVIKEISLRPLFYSSSPKGKRQEK